MEKRKEYVTVNGELKLCEPGSTLLSYLESAGLDPKLAIAEHNGEIVKPECFAGRGLKDGDRVEFIRFVGGG